MAALVSPALPPGTLSGHPQPSLPGPGVELRPWREADAPVLVTAYRDPEIQRWHCRSLDDDEAVAAIERWLGAWHAETAASWAVTDQGDRVLGRVGLRELNLTDGAAEVSYWVLPAARGHGVARAAVTALTHWAFHAPGFRRLELRHSVANPGSCRVAAATRFTVEGTLRGATRHADGWHDMHLHSRLRTDDVDAGRDTGR